MVEKNEHYSRQNGHMQRTAFHDALKRASLNGITISRGDLDVSNIRWVRKRHSRRITNPGTR